MRFAITARFLLYTVTVISTATTPVMRAQALPIVVSTSTAATQNTPHEGQVAPSFTLPSQSGQQTSLVSFKGKWVVLYFYPEDFTSGCTLEAHNFQRDATKFQKLNAVIVGVSVDSVDSHKQFCAKEGLNIKLLSDVGRKVLSQYGSLNSKSQTAQRNTFLIDPEGKIARVWINVTPAQHSAEVLSAINAKKQN